MFTYVVSNLQVSHGNIVAQWFGCGYTLHELDDINYDQSYEDIYFYVHYYIPKILY